MMIEPVGPIRHSMSVTPNDSADLSMPARALLVGVAGDVKLTYDNGVVDTLYLEAGMWHGMYVRRVWSTGTTATGIHVGY